MRSIYLLFIPAALLLASCQKDLNFPDYNKTPVTAYWQTAADAQSAVISCYGKLVDWPFFEPTTFGPEEIASDNTAKGSTPDDQPDVLMMKNYTFTPSLTGFNTFWNSRYSAINVCNQAITNIPGINMDEATKKQLLGEARFIRAWLYFEMVRMFGEVVVYDGLPASNNYNIAKSPIDSGYGFIVRDLQYGIDNMRKDPWETQWLGRVNSWSAKALLAKVKFYMASGTNFAGHAINGTTWSDVKALTDDVIQNGPYRLHTAEGDSAFYYLFRMKNENCEESIFEAQCGASKLAGSINRSAYAVYQWVRGMSGWGFNVPTDGLLAAWHARGYDNIRMKASIAWNGETLPDGTVIDGDLTQSGTNAGSPGYDPARYNFKVYVPAAEDANLTWMYGAAQNPRLLRFADILLIDAEAELNLGNTAGALASINLVRDRVREPALTTLQMQDIWDERHFELAFENDRWFDLVRSGQAAAVLGPQGFKSPKNNFYPVPQQQIDLSGGVLTQNTNYK